MGLKQTVDALYSNGYNADLARQLTLPAGPAVTLTANAAGSTYGVWADVALAATILGDTLVVGVVLSAPSATDVFTVQIGSCLVGGVNYANAAAVIAGGAGIIAAAARQEVRIDWAIVVVTAVGEFARYGGFIPLHIPIRIPIGVGIIGRTYGITAAAVTINASVAAVTGLA